MPHRYTPEEMTAKLVSFETVSDRTNLPLIDFVGDYLAEHGVECLRLPDVTGTKAALFATIGPRGMGGVCLSGHVDVVPVEGQAWTGPPFQVVRRDGRLFGRGTTDMKGFVGTALALVPDFLSAGLATPIHLCLSYDEETNCLGSLDAIRRFGRDLPKPIACIVGEPTLMEVVDAQKSLACFVTTVTGRPAHSALPDLGANALHAAAHIVAEIDRIADELRGRGDPSGRFDPPFSTAQVGQMKGGEAVNIVPEQAVIRWEFRGVPSLALDEVPERVRRFSRDVVESRLRRTVPSASVTTEPYIVVPVLAPDPGSAAETLALRLAGRNGTRAISYATEAGHFQQAGVPTVVCGPGSIEQAHRPDEWIETSQLDACASFMRGLAATLAG